MVLTEEGIVTETRLVQSLKAKSPIEVTEEGMVTETRLVHSRKASSSMEVQEEGISTFPFAAGGILQVEWAALGNRPNTASHQRFISTDRARTL